MTSKISFFKLMQEDMKRKIWLLILAFLVFFISFPVALLVLMENAARYYNLSQEIIQLRMRTEYLSLMGYENIWMVVVTIAGASLCGIFGFSYLYNKKKVDFYHSIPVRREKFFFVSYVNGILIYVIPYLVSIAACLLIGSRYTPVDSEVLGTVCKGFGIQLLYFLLIYHTAILTTVLAGNMFGGLFLNAAAQLYAVAVYVIYTAYCSSYFDTYCYTEDTVLNITDGFSPIMAFINAVNRLIGGGGLYQLQLRDGAVSMRLYLMQSLIAAILLLAAAAFLYKIRSGEMSGKAIAFPIIQPVLRILIVIPSALAGGWIFTQITNDSSTGWMIFGILFSAVLVHGIIEVLYQSDIRGILSHKLQLAGSIAAVFIIAFSFQRDLFGYDTYLPKQENIESAAVSITGIEQGRDYRIYDKDNTHFYKIPLYTYQMEEMELSGEMLSAVYQLMSLGVWQEKQQEYIEKAADVYIKVRLKDGKEVTRSYYISLETAYDFLSTIYASQEYKETTYAYFLENIEKAQNVEIYGTLGYDKLSEAEGAELLEIYKKELMALTLDDIRDNPIIGEISYHIPFENRDGYDYERLYLYPSMTETFSCLERMGVTEEVAFWTKPDAENVTEVRVGYDVNYAIDERLVPEEEIPGAATATSSYCIIEMKDAAQIQEMCEKLYFVYNDSENPMFWNEYRGLDIAVGLKEDEPKYLDEEEGVYIEAVLRPSEEIPECLIEAILEEMKKPQ